MMVRRWRIFGDFYIYNFIHQEEKHQKKENQTNKSNDKEST